MEAAFQRDFVNELRVITGDIQFPVGTPDQHKGNQKGEDIRNGHGEQHAVQTKENRQQQRKANAEDDFPNHGQRRGFQCYSLEFRRSKTPKK